MTAMTTSKFGDCEELTGQYLNQIGSSEPDWNRIFSSLRLDSEPCTCVQTAARRPPQFSKTSRLAEPVFHFCQRGASHSQGLGSLHHASNCCRVHGAATLSHSQVFDQEFHPPSIGPRQGINCRRAIVWSDCLGQWSPSRCSANSPLPRHGPICTSAVALLEQFEGSQKKKMPPSSLQSASAGGQEIPPQPFYHQSPAHVPS